jgi:hypothetical protein
MLTLVQMIRLLPRTATIPSPQPSDMPRVAFLHLSKAHTLLVTAFALSHMEVTELLQATRIGVDNQSGFDHGIPQATTVSASTQFTRHRPVA